MIAALDQAKVEFVGSIDDIAISNGETLDGVFVHGEFKDVRSIPSDQDVFAPSSTECVVAFAATKEVFARTAAQDVVAKAPAELIISFLCNKAVCTTSTGE